MYHHDSSQCSPVLKIFHFLDLQFPVGERHQCNVSFTIINHINYKILISIKIFTSCLKKELFLFSGMLAYSWSVVLRKLLKRLTGQILLKSLKDFNETQRGSWQLIDAYKSLQIAILFVVAIKAQHILKLCTTQSWTNIWTTSLGCQCTQKHTNTQQSATIEKRAAPHSTYHEISLQETSSGVWRSRQSGGSY